MSLLFPLGMAALGALVPLLALYLLKQRRVEVEVPSNFLWARALEDLRASSLFQRLRTTVLLALQALAVALFALAASGASLDLSVGRAPRRVIALVDRSASMKAADEDGRTRFDVARDLARDLALGLSGADEMMLAAFDERAEVVVAFTDDRRRLVEAIGALTARDLPTRADEAVRLAASFAQASRGFEAEVWIVSDGAVEADLPTVPCKVSFARVGRAAANQGIVSLRAERSPGEPVRVFVRVENADAAPVTRTVALRRGAVTVDARSLDLAPGGGATAVFELAEPDSAEPQEVVAALAGEDSLAADDAVPFLVRPAVPRAGLVVSAEPSLYLDPRKLERLHPGLALVAATPEEATAALAKGDGAVDFVLFDGVAPAEVPPAPAQVYVDALPPGSGLVAEGRMEYPIVLDWDRTHPVTARCQFDDVLVAEATRLGGAERSRVLVESTGGPLVLLTPLPGREVLVLAFSPARSNLPLKLAWPLLLASAMDHLLGGVEKAGEEPVARTGVPLDLGEGEGADVETPSGTTTPLAPGARGRLVFAATHENGVYRARGAGGVRHVHARALLHAGETRIAPRPSLTLGADTVAATTSPVRRNVLLRDPLLVAALGLLVLEWALWCSRR